MVFTNDFLKSMESLSLYPEKSNEAISDQMETTPPGGDLASDSAGESENPNEQINELDSNTGDSGDFGGTGDSGGEDSGGGDFGGGDGDASSTDTSEGDGTIKLEPFQNPFKAQNGKQVLDLMFDKLHNAIMDTIDKIHANDAVKSVVISQFESLIDNVEKARETIYVLPKEASMVKYRICVKLYNKLCESLCDDIKNGSNSR